MAPLTSSLTLLAVALSSTPASYAWGALGHETIAYIAQDFVSAATHSYIIGILGSDSTNTSYMAAVSTWADTFRATSAGSWSAPLHFVDAEDNPPTTCDVDFSRDCGSTGCVISAINNYTGILQKSTSSASLKLDAMRFVIHFVGDIHQPLHDEALELGGNDIAVTYGGSKTNLHAVWDTSIVQDLASGTTITTARTFATKLTGEIKSGSTGWSPTSWTTGLSLSNPVTTATSWATQANAYVCSDVIPNGVSAVETGDLDGAYFTAHNHVVSIQLARAGYRLAAWLNLLATGTTGGL